MDREKLLARLTALFLDELRDHVHGFDEGLVALEKDPRSEGADELWKTLLRRAHSLKGAAAAVELPVVERACHALEGLLGALRGRAVEPAPEVFQLLFAAADGLRDAADRIRAGSPLGDGPLASLAPRLEAAARAAEKPATPRADPRSGGPATPPRPAGLAVPPPSPAPPALPATPPPTTGRGEPAPGSSGGAVSQGGLRVREAWLRVPAERLDALLARAGEMAVSARRLREQVGAAHELRETAERLRASFAAVERRSLRSLAVRGEGSADARAGLAARRVHEDAARLAADLDRFAIRLERDQLALELLAVPIDEEMRLLRMVPFEQACEGLERAVRDVARRAGKDAGLVLEGAAVQLDRAVVAALREPLVHLVRNAVDHGVEPPAARALAGKPNEARVVVSARLRGRRVEVAVEDDGRGLDTASIRAQAVRLGIPVPEDEAEVATLVFAPGFSTRRSVSEISGRGIGLDVVKSRVESLHGSVAVRSTPGAGTRFTLSLPLTLANLNALVVEASGQLFAFATPAIARIVRIGPGDLRAANGRDSVILDGAAVPVVRLDEALGLRRAEPGHVSDKAMAVVVAIGPAAVAFVVDRDLGKHELVVKGLGPRLRRVRNLAGGALMPSGDIVLIVSAGELARNVLAQAVRQRAAPLGGTQRPARLRVLVVDDSVTTRTLEKSILESAGYDVVAASDGDEAWRLLQQSSFDILVSDVEMPRMSGLSLTEAVRASQRLRELPVILVTALWRDEDKARGAAAGADAYLVKSAFDQRELLDTIVALVGRS